MKPRSVLIGLGVTVAVAAGVGALAYLAGGIWFLSNRLMPHGIEWDTWLSAWRQLQDNPTQRNRLIFSAGAAFVVIFVLPPLAIAHLVAMPRKLHGDARFARADEISRQGLLADKPGILVGRLGSRYLIFPGQQFVMLAAPTRSGKGVGVVIPNLLNWPDSVVVLDIKLENFEKTSGYRAASGQAVYLFNPFAEDGRTSRWNPFDAVSRDPALRAGELLAIAQTIFPGTDTDGYFFWNTQARNIMLGLALYLKETPGRQCTFGELLREASGRGQPIREHLDAIVVSGLTGPVRLSDTCIAALMRVVSMSDNTMSSAMATFTGPLTIFANPIVDAATSATDFDVTDLRKRRMSIYLGIPPNRLADAALLLNLFFSNLLMLNTRELPSANPALKHQCLLLMDEFTAIGKIAILPRAVGYIAGYNLRLLPVIQSVAQLKSVYGELDAQAIMTNHAMQIIFAPRELRDAQEYSEALGYSTELRESRSRTQSLSAMTPGSRSVNESEQRRALMLPQELRELDATKEIILLEGSRPILCDKVRYYDDPVFMGRLLPPAEVDRIVSPAGALPTAGDDEEGVVQVGAADALDGDLPVYDRVALTEAQAERIADYAEGNLGLFDRFGRVDRETGASAGTRAARPTGSSAGPQREGAAMGNWFERDQAVAAWIAGAGRRSAPAMQAAQGSDTTAGGSAP